MGEVGTDSKMIRKPPLKIRKALKKMDRKKKQTKLLLLRGHRHIRADIEHLYIHREEQEASCTYNKQSRSNES
jgi:hypothetical protein